MFFGFSVLLILAILAGVIALGKVEQSTSHGLDQILGGLLILAGGFSQWCFQSQLEKDKDAPTKPSGNEPHQVI